MNSEWQAFRLVPDDVLFFRDGKPSSRGADHYLRSLFPPHPSTLYGALRTRRLLDEGVRLEGLDRSAWGRLPQTLRAELGEWGGFGSLTVRGPWLVRGEEPLFPAPADLGICVAERPRTDQGRKGRRRGGYTEPHPPVLEQVVRFRLQEPTAAGERGGHSHGCALLQPYLRRGTAWSSWPEGRREPRPVAGWYLNAKGLDAWRGGDIPALEDFVHKSELWTDEARTGLGLESGDRRSEEHMLYTFGYVRLRQEVALGFEARGTALAPGSRVRLGGEARTALLETGPRFPVLNPATVQSAPRRLRVALVTPALARAGGYPPGFSSVGGQERLAGRRCQFLGGVVGGFVLVGGWDLARSRAKPLRRALPAGSVFVLKDLDGGSAADFDGLSISEFETSERLAGQGFGLVAAGNDS